MVANISIKVVNDENGRIRTLPYSLQLDKQGEWSYNELVNEWMPRMHSSVAKEVLKEELTAKKLVSGKYTTLVDNAKNVEEERVKPFGRILYFSNILLLNFLKDIYASLINLSPSYTGLYSNTHIILFKQREIARTQMGLFNWIIKNPEINRGDQITFVNVLPYSRMLENRGVTNNWTKTSIKWYGKKDRNRKRNRNKAYTFKPDGVYHQTYMKYRTISKQYADAIKFEFLTGQELGLGTSPLISGNSKQAFRGSFLKDGRPYLYPAITVKLFGGGD